MKYEFTYFSKEHDYWLGTDLQSGQHILGIPVSNPMVDYIESYWLDDQQYQNFLKNQDLAIEFSDACRRHEHDDRLTHKPGKYRGTPR
ncbi:hypothetical protein AWC26_20130 [Mycobacterium shimoidei]|uniref:Uncharacterized protein n=1 Tax=Mycobacterium shimoidei TaxID=29313 RepID=A0A1E3SQL5_MYCSH|nr:hypothetical protein [Mycobacterium shimoidei]ODR04444.1 hypothetical protein BHQ16_22310 [Mycobacterium shimoidei]ORW77040.1 hypothetical protein AWC26_20130 [Mycobacterium shimoidei]SSA20663.1 hypothetical protein MSP7336_04695 [Mycobacterium shimoidei]